MLLAVDGYRYGGRDFDRSEAVGAIAAEIGAAGRAARLPRRPSGWEDGFLGAPASSTFEPRAVRPPALGALLLGHDRAAQGDRAGQGGILLEHLKKMHLHLDAREGDRVFWFTTTGWMMWNFLVGVLLTDAAIVLYDGNPGTPDLGRAVGPRRGRRDDVLRHERELHRRRA